MVLAARGFHLQLLSRRVFIQVARVVPARTASIVVSVWVRCARWRWAAPQGSAAVEALTTNVLHEAVWAFLLTLDLQRQPLRLPLRRSGDVGTTDSFDASFAQSPGAEGGNRDGARALRSRGVDHASTVLPTMACTFPPIHREQTLACPIRPKRRAVFCSAPAPPEAHLARLDGSQDAERPQVVDPSPIERPSIDAGDQLLSV